MPISETPFTKNGIFDPPPPIQQNVISEALPIQKIAFFETPLYNKMAFWIPSIQHIFPPPLQKWPKLDPHIQKNTNIWSITAKIWSKMVKNGSNLTPSYKKFDTSLYKIFQNLTALYKNCRNLNPYTFVLPPPLYTKNEPPCTTKWYFRAPLYKKWHF